MAFKTRQIISMIGAAVVIGFVSMNHKAIRDWFKPPEPMIVKKEPKA